MIMDQYTVRTQFAGLKPYFLQCINTRVLISQPAKGLRGYLADGSEMRRFPE